MDAFADLCEALDAAPSPRARRRLIDEWLISLDSPSRTAAESLLSREAVSVPAAVVARLPAVEPASRSLCVVDALAALEALLAEPSPAAKLAHLTTTLGELTARAAPCFLGLATGTLRLGERAPAPTLGTLAVVVTSVRGRKAALAVRGREGFVELGHATLPEDERLAPLLEALVVERDGARRLLRPELVLEVSFTGVRRDARWRSGYALATPVARGWLSNRQPFAADTIERVEAFFERSQRPRASTPPPVRSHRLDDLPLFGVPAKTDQE